MSVGIGKIERYYPVLISTHGWRDEKRYYLEDVKAWAKGDFATLGDIDEEISWKVSALAQLVLNAVAKMEKDNVFPPEARRIECRKDDDLKGVEDAESD